MMSPPAPLPFQLDSACFCPQHSIPQRSAPRSSFVCFDQPPVQRHAGCMHQRQLHAEPCQDRGRAAAGAVGGGAAAGHVLAEVAVNGLAVLQALPGTGCMPNDASPIAAMQ
jgi:hypothetical protein